jgi:hypothetical protein
MMVRQRGHKGQMMIKKMAKSGFEGSVDGLDE